MSVIGIGIVRTTEIDTGIVIVSFIANMTFVILTATFAIIMTGIETVETGVDVIEVRTVAIATEIAWADPRPAVAIGREVIVIAEVIRV